MVKISKIWLKSKDFCQNLEYSGQNIENFGKISKMLILEPFGHNLEHLCQIFEYPRHNLEHLCQNFEHYGQNLNYFGQNC